MAIIGQFTKKERGYEGRIKTLEINIRDIVVTPLPDEEKQGPKTPDHAITSQDILIGAGWSQTAKVGGRSYIRCKFDDPSLKEPLYASLIEDSGGIYNLIWSRGRKS